MIFLKKLIESHEPKAYTLKSFSLICNIKHFIFKIIFFIRIQINQTLKELFNNNKLFNIISYI